MKDSLRIIELHERLSHTDSLMYRAPLTCNVTKLNNNTDDATQHSPSSSFINVRLSQDIRQVIRIFIPLLSNFFIFRGLGLLISKICPR
jgi:hypothetical protein